MWISKKRLKEKEEAARTMGLELGYKLGCQGGQAGGLNKALCDNRRSLVDLQVEEILLRKSEE